MTTAIIFAGGTGQRMKNSAKPKQFLELYGKPIIIYTLEVFERHHDVDGIVIPCVAGWEAYLEELVRKFGITKVKKIVAGGKDTQESKMNALRWLEPVSNENDIVILHDAVRPLIDEQLITDNIEAVKKFGSAISSVPFSETAIVSEDRLSTAKTIPRNTLFIAKAPQSFYFRDVWQAHNVIYPQSSCYSPHPRGASLLNKERRERLSLYSVCFFFGSSFFTGKRKNYMPRKAFLTYSFSSRSLPEPLSTMLPFSIT